MNLEQSKRNYMKSNIIKLIASIIILSFFMFNSTMLSGCTINMENNLDSSKIKKYKERQVFVFNINNSNPKEFGFKHYEDEPDLSVYKIFKYDNYLYFVDGYHRNVKRYDIINKKMICSNLLDNAIEDLQIRNDTIYVISTIDIFLLNTDLKLIKYIRYKYENMPDIYKRVSMSDYKNIKINNVIVLSNEYGVYEIKEDIPIFTNMCPGNVYYDLNTIAYYGIRKKQLIVYLYTY